PAADGDLLPVKGGGVRVDPGDFLMLHIGTCPFFAHGTMRSYFRRMQTAVRTYYKRVGGRLQGSVAKRRRIAAAVREFRNHHLRGSISEQISVFV
ncbi:MAG: hypothetical protein IKS66_03325, partial [Oscillospiraceae bacterium]|nr:hypothetical protein [Oscillospiraceae bacterium]